MRAVLDPDVIIAALLSSRGAPAAALAAWQDGAYDLVVSTALLEELERALGYPKLRERIGEAEADEVRAWLERTAILLDDPVDLPRGQRSSRDPGDDYLLALAARAEALLVTGDLDLLELSQELPIHSPGSFVSLLRV